jgi:hypothetical protein
VDEYTMFGLDYCNDAPTAIRLLMITPRAPRAARLLDDGAGDLVLYKHQFGQNDKARICSLHYYLFTRALDDHGNAAAKTATLYFNGGPVASVSITYVTGGALLLAGGYFVAASKAVRALVGKQFLSKHLREPRW